MHGLHQRIKLIFFFFFKEIIEQGNSSDFSNYTFFLSFSSLWNAGLMFGGKEIADLSKLIGIIKRQHKTSLFTKKTFFLVSITIKKILPIFFFRYVYNEILLEISSNKVQKHGGQKCTQVGHFWSLAPNSKRKRSWSCKNLKRFIFVTCRVTCCFSK